MDSRCRQHVIICNGRVRTHAWWRKYNNGWPYSHGVSQLITAVGSGALPVAASNDICCVAGFQHP